MATGWVVHDLYGLQSAKAALIPSPHHPLRQRRKSSVVRHRRQSTANSLPSIGMSVLLAGYYPSLFQQFLVQVKHHPGHHSSLSSSCAVFFFSSSSSLLYFSLLSFWTSPERKGDRSRTVNPGIAGRFLSTLCINSSTKSFFSMKKAEAAALCCGQNV